MGEDSCMDPYRKARIKIKNRKKFIWHVIFFVPLSFLLIAINVGTETDPWSLMIVFPWAFILVVHCILTFIFPSVNVFSSDWDDLEMDREVRKIQDYEALPEGDYQDYFERSRPFSVRAMDKVRIKYSDEDFV